MRKILTVLTVLCLFVAGCGKSDKKNDAKGGSPKTTAASGKGSGDAAKKAGLQGKVNDHGTKPAADGATVEMEMDDVYFNPTFIKAKPGAHITLELKNEGKLRHTFSMDSPKADEELAPDSTKKISVTVPSGKSGAFYCKFHKGGGMQGVRERLSPTARTHQRKAGPGQDRGPTSSCYLTGAWLISRPTMPSSPGLRPRSGQRERPAPIREHRLRCGSRHSRPRYRA